MENLKIPEGYQQVMPYLILPDAEKFLEFTKKVFGAKEKMKVMRDDDATIMHAEVSIGDCVIMFAQSSDDWGTSTTGLYVYVEDADKTYQTALDEGAVSIMAPADQSYGRSGGVKDPSGNTWWVVSNP